MRNLCLRQYQNSIDDSVLKLLADQVSALGMNYLFDVQRTQIIGRGSAEGSAFAFDGLARNLSSMKSFEGADVAWVEEAQDVTKQAWEILIPTIRKEGSEIWVSFNPELDTDETYVRFVKNKPTNALVRKVNHSDNPWFPEVLRQEMADLKARDEDAYLNIWEGHCRQSLDGAVYAGEIRAATAEGRICRVPYEPKKPVHTFWDLGKADNTAIWFAQVVGFEFRLIDYYQAHGKNLQHYVKVLREKPYAYERMWLPHDAKHDLLASELTIEQQMKAHGFVVKITPKNSVAAGIEAARSVFSKCYFDEQKTSDGLQCLRHYQYERKSDGMSFTKEPLHNWASHGADAFRYLAIALTEDKKPPTPQRAMPRGHQSHGWLGR